MKIAATCVFIAKENIPFLEEWIAYHHILGIDQFYLYDNTEVQVMCNWDKSNGGRKAGMVPGKINKHGFDFDSNITMSDDDVTAELERIKSSFPAGVVNYIKWSPRDSQGRVIYGQVEAHNHCLKMLQRRKGRDSISFFPDRYGSIDWCASIDIDEFIVLRYKENIKLFLSDITSDISSIRLNQLRFGSRFNNLNKHVIEITDHYPGECGGYKYIYNISRTTHVHIHEVTSSGREYNDREKIWFNHYKGSNKGVYLDNIASHIKEEIIN